MDDREFKQRTKLLAVMAVRLVESLPSRRATDIVARQLLRSMTSVGANYRAACRARSPQEMFAKLSIVEEEADESLYWLEVLVESGLAPAGAVVSLTQETDEILAMVVASKKTLRARIQRANPQAGPNRQSTVDNRQSARGSR
jgi:four helix bundle protein